MRILTLLMKNYEKKENWVISRDPLIPLRSQISVFPLSALFRMIHHLSYPKGASINDGIPPEFSSVKYASVDDAISHIQRQGKGCAMAKTDVRSAFCIVPVHPSDYPLLGFQWKEKWYYDKTLPMGCSSSCQIFEDLSTAMEWVGKNKLQIPNIVHILDDFLIIDKSLDTCGTKLNRFLQFCHELGVPMAEEKTVGPAHVLTFAGIELDCLKHEARLPREKVEKCREVIIQFLSRKKVTLKELQSLIGLLNFACSIIKPGRVFLRRLINLTIGVVRPMYFIRLTLKVKNDLRIWQQFLTSFNCQSLFLEEVWTPIRRPFLLHGCRTIMRFWCYLRHALDIWQVA